MTCKIHFPQDDLTTSGQRHKGGVNGEIELIKELIKASRTKRVRLLRYESARCNLEGKMVIE